MTHIKQDYKHLEERSKHFGHVVYGWADLIDGVQFLHEHSAQLTSARELVQAQLAIREKSQRLTTLEEAITHEDVCIAEAVVYAPNQQSVFLRASPILDPWHVDGKAFAISRYHKGEYELRYPFHANNYLRDALELEEKQQEISARDFFVTKDLKPLTLRTSSNACYDEVAHNFRCMRPYEHPLVQWLFQESKEQKYGSESFADLHRYYGHPWIKINLLNEEHVNKQEKPFLKQIAISALRNKYSSCDFTHIHCDTPNKETQFLFVGKIKEKQDGKV